MEKLLLPFYRTGLWIMNKIPETGWKKKGEERLRALYPGGRRSVKEYYAGRLAIILAVLFWGAGAALFTELVLESREKEAGEQYLSRPAYGQGEWETELEAFVEGETEGTVLPIRVGEQEYTPEEVQEIFRSITDGLEQEILGENESLEEVRSDLTLPSSLWGGTVTVEWVLSPSDVLDHSGAVLKEVGEEGELVELRALLKYREQEAEYTCYAHVCPPVRTKREILEKKLKEEVEKADQEGKYSRTLILPLEIEDRKVSWRKPAAHTGAALAVLALVGAVLVWLFQERELERKEKERRQQLVLDYPEVLFKMAMLLGAGLTLKGTFQKIASEYRKRKDEHPRFVYEEMLFACREMENGVGEAAAYESFGRRCGDSRYVKLGSILSQNLKKGAKGLQELLEQEAAAGFEERKHMARKLGEEAGTRLLFPMMLMLGVVLVILIVPAVMNF